MMNLQVTSFTSSSWCRMLFLLSLVPSSLSPLLDYSHLLICLPMEGQVKYCGLSWASYVKVAHCKYSMWPQYLSCNSGVLIFHLVLIFVRIFCSRNQHSRRLYRFTPDWYRYEGDLLSLLLLNNKHMWHSALMGKNDNLLGVKCCCNYDCENILLFLII